MSRTRVVLAVLFLALLAPAAAAQSRLTEDERQMLHQLETYLITMDFQEAPFEDVIEYIRQTTAINMVIDPGIYQERTPDEMKVSLKVSKLPVLNALKLLLEVNRLDYVFKNGVFLITLAGARQQQTYSQTYDIRDLMFEIRDFPGPDISLSSPDEQGGIGAVFGDEPSPGDDLTQPDVIQDILRENTGIGTWDAESVGMRVVGGILVVRQSEEVHQEIERMLNMLRTYK